MYKQNIGLTHTAARTSSFAACYLRLTEQKQLSKIVMNFSVRGYLEYVDDIMITYDDHRKSLLIYARHAII
jgi:hypothetical protein